MLREPFSLSPDLKRLRDEGYAVQIKGNLLVLTGVPYVNVAREVRTGTLISPLVLAGEVTCPPDTHIVWWDGEFPCDPDGVPIDALRHRDQYCDLGHGVSARHSFSNKPIEGYQDYHHKMTTYVAVIAGSAATVAPGANARPYAAPEPEDDNPFHYTEMASARAGIGSLMEKLAPDQIAIIGLGGTGSYVLDFVAKTPVAEIHLFDGDTFLQHNAFRSPGASPIEELRKTPLKVDYFKRLYEHMHRHIVTHPIQLNADTVGELMHISFAFICIDDGPSKRIIIDQLEAIGASFVDLGMGLELDKDSLGGILRVTASTPGNRDHVHQGRIDFTGGGGNDVYASNIQVADLNAFNALMAVIKWKKLRGFYRDLERELHCTYTTDGNLLLNGELP
jgi:hypothetical protein